jgi:hypothetical protein
MKKNYKIFLLFFAVLTLLLGYSCNNTNGGSNSANQVISTDTAIISFREYEHDFGKIAEGEKVACIFTFENTGKGPLIISAVTTSCGCTVPKYDRKPIATGNIGNIEVIFDSSGRNGRQTKTISVMSNASKPIVLIRITGEVINSNNN